MSPQEFTTKINHAAQRNFVVLSILVSSAWTIAKSILSFLLLKPEQRDLTHMLSLASYIFTTNLIAVVQLQFMFFSFSILNRYKVFANSLTESPRLPGLSLRESMKIFSIQHATLSRAVIVINSTFTVQVIQSFSFF
jgi:hypothetical protein